MGTVSQKVLVSYWRGEDQFAAHRVAELLAPIFGSERVTLDDATLSGPEDAQAIFRNVAQCAALFVIVGRGWESARNESYRGYLTDPEDGVQLAIDAALKLDKVIVPILADGVAMPRPEDLPGVMSSFGVRGEVRKIRDSEPRASMADTRRYQRTISDEPSSSSHFTLNIQRFMHKYKRDNLWVNSLAISYNVRLSTGSFHNAWQKNRKYILSAMTLAAVVGVGVGQFSSYPLPQHPNQSHRNEFAPQTEHKLHDRPGAKPN